MAKIHKLAVVFVLISTEQHLMICFTVCSWTILLGLAVIAAAQEDAVPDPSPNPTQEHGWSEGKASENYVEQGEVVDADGLPVYAVTHGKNDDDDVGKRERCVIFNYDVFGFNSGRTRELVDFIASKGTMVGWRCCCHFPYEK